MGERKKQLTELQKIRLSLVIGLFSVFVSSALVGALKAALRKQAVYSKGWSEEEKLAVLSRWRRKERTINVVLAVYMAFTLFSLFSFVLARDAGTFTWSVLMQILMNVILFPFVIALFIAHVLTKASTPGERLEIYHNVLAHSPGLADFSHEMHDNLGHFRRRDIKA